MVTNGDPKIIQIENRADERGILYVLDNLAVTCFNPSRIFVVTGLEIGQTRGGHAHRTCSQLLFSMNGDATITAINKNSTFVFSLLSGQNALLVPALNWLEFSLTNSSTSLVVLASHKYDDDDYIRNLEDLKTL